MAEAIRNRARSGKAIQHRCRRRRRHDRRRGENGQQSGCTSKQMRQVKMKSERPRKTSTRFHAQHVDHTMHLTHRLEELTGLGITVDDLWATSSAAARRRLPIASLRRDSARLVPTCCARVNTALWLRHAAATTAAVPLGRSCRSEETCPARLPVSQDCAGTGNVSWGLSEKGER